MKMLNPREVAGILHVSVDTVMRLCRTKRLPSRKVGRLWRINGEVLEQWTRQGETQGKKSTNL